MSRPTSIRFPDDLRAWLDERRGDMPFHAFVLSLLRRARDDETGPAEGGDLRGQAVTGDERGPIGNSGQAVGGARKALKEISAIGQEQARRESKGASEFRPDFKQPRQKR